MAMRMSSIFATIIVLFTPLSPDESLPELLSGELPPPGLLSGCGVVFVEGLLVPSVLLFPWDVLQKLRNGFRIGEKVRNAAPMPN